MVGVLGSVAWAQGPPVVTSQGAELETGADAALDEADGFGLAVVVSGFLSDNIWGVQVQNLKANQGYILNNNDGANPCTTGQIGPFTTGPAGAASASFMSAAGLEAEVHVCRSTDQVLTGTLGDVIQAVKGRRPF